MRALWIAVFGIGLVIPATGCMLVDYAVDPVGCQTGSHEPIFPWYPSYIWNPPQPRPQYSVVNPAPQIPGGPAVAYPPPVQQNVQIDPATGRPIVLEQ